jgi:hypothetical protein
MRSRVRLALGTIVVFGIACGGSTEPAEKQITLQSVDGNALPAIVLESQGLVWEVTRGHLVSAVGDGACSYVVTLIRTSSPQNEFDVTGSQSCAWSGNSVSFRTTISFTPSIGAHTYAFSVVQ